MLKNKKIVSLFLASAMLFSLAVPAMASPVKATSATREYGITERVNADGVIFRTLVRDRAVNSIAHNYELTREELKQLGLDERAVENIDSEILAELAASPEILSSITYYRVNAAGEMQIVEENVALAAATSESDDNQYVRVVVTSSKSTPVDGQNAYFIQGSFTWLTEPKLGGKEFFGLGSTNCTFASKDANGYVSWRRKEYNNNGTVASNKVEKLTQNPKLKTDKDGQVQGVGYEFSIPITRYSSTTGRKVVEYSEWYGYISAKGVIGSTQVGSFYNSATYLHQTIVTQSTITFQLIFDRSGLHPSAIYTATPEKAYVSLPVSVQQLT